MGTARVAGLTVRQRFVKRALDIVLAVVTTIALSWLLVIVWIVASIDTRANGFFLQARIGRNGRPFRVVKVRTMRHNPDITILLCKIIPIRNSQTVRMGLVDYVNRRIVEIAARKNRGSPGSAG